MGYGIPLAFELEVLRILQPVGIDDAMLRIRQQWKIQRAAAICRDFIRESLAIVMTIDADGPQAHLLVGFKQGP